VCRRATIRHRARRSEYGDAYTRAHNTLSAGATDVQVLYPFHPLHGSSLRLIRRPKRGDGAVTVLDTHGRRLKIPTWMLSAEAAETRIAEQAYLSKHALQSLADLLAIRLSTEDNHHDNLLPRVTGPQGGQPGTVATSRRKKEQSRSRARRRQGPQRGHRSDGPHSRSRISNSGRKK
jgi:hypothetical protein